MTYPLDMPALMMGLQQFEPQHLDYLSPEAGGRLGGVKAGNPLWSALWSLSSMDDLDSDVMRAFVARLRGSQRAFLGYDQSRPFPRAYRNGFAGMTRAIVGTVFDGMATLWTQAVNADGDATATFYGLPAGFKIAIGDYAGWKWDASGAPVNSYQRRTLARAVAPAVANSEGVLSVMIEPPVPVFVVPAGARAHFDRPACVMKILGEKTQLGPTNYNEMLQSGTIAALQDLRP